MINDVIYSMKLIDNYLDVRSPRRNSCSHEVLSTSDPTRILVRIPVKKILSQIAFNVPAWIPAQILLGALLGVLLGVLLGSLLGAVPGALLGALLGAPWELSWELFWELSWELPGARIWMILASHSGTRFPSVPRPVFCDSIYVESDVESVPPGTGLSLLYPAPK